MKMNKKGFTLIEMLVVIAIIAVLVAIIIPTVTSATTKAAAATNAANLRSTKAAIVTAALSDVTFADGNYTAAQVNDKLTNDIEIPAAKTGAGEAAGTDLTFGLTVSNTGKTFVVTYGAYDIDDWANAAEDGSLEADH